LKVPVSLLLVELSAESIVVITFRDKVHVVCVCENRDVWCVLQRKRSVRCR